MTTIGKRRGPLTADGQYFLAIGYVCLAGVLFVLMNVMVKALTDEFETVMLVWARYAFHVAVIAALFPGKLIGVVRTPQVKMQILRSVLLLGATVTNFIALIYLPLGTVASITFTSPVMVAALAIVLLREKVTALHWLAIGGGLAGALIIIQPGAETFNIGALLAFACAACYAFYQISTRMVREAEPVVSLLYGGLVGMIAFSALVPFHWTTPTPLQWAMFAGIGALGAAGHLAMIMALRIGEASRISPFTYMQLVWAMLASFLVFGDVPGISTIGGALIIVASGLLLIHLQRRRA